MVFGRLLGIMPAEASVGSHSQKGEDRMKRGNSVGTLLAALATLLVPAVAHAALRTTISLPLEPAFHDGRLAYFLSLEFSDRRLAMQTQAVWAPKLRFAKPAGQEELFAFTNGAPGQVDVIESIPQPGVNADYSPDWRLTFVRWASNVPTAERKVVKSADDVEALVQAGKLEESDSGANFNCPVIVVNANDDGTGGDLAPTLKLGAQVLGFEEAKGHRFVTLTVEPGWAFGIQYGFLALDHATKAVPPNLTGIATVAKLGLDQIGEDATSDFFVVLNADGTSAQALPVLEFVPGQVGYSPFWHIDFVQWKQGVQTRVLRSAADIDRAKARGEVTVTEGDPQAVFNCPVVARG
jgi:hypothetical protein